jgi:hypothetical protein
VQGEELFSIQSLVGGGEALFKRKSLHGWGGGPKILTLINVTALLMLYMYRAKLENKGQTVKHLLLNIL